MTYLRPVSTVLLLIMTQASPAKDLDLRTDAQKSSYALGVDYMKGLYQDDLKLDNQAFLQGLLDVQSGRGSRLSEAETRRGLDYFIVQRVRHRQEKAARNLAGGKEFLLANRSKPGVVALDSGLQYKVLAEGAGKRPGPADGVAVRFLVRNVSGKELLSSGNGKEPLGSGKDGKPAKLLVDGLIPAFKEALPMMKEGAKWQLFLPPELAYGEAGTPDGKIGANEALIYEVELVSIVPADEVRKEMEKPTIVGGKPTKFE